MTSTMVLGFEILLDYNNKVLELKKEDTSWVPTDWANYMNPDAMTTLLGDPICNIEEEEYWEACQHALKSLYELRTNNEDEEGGAAPSDDEDGSEDKSDSCSDSSSSNSGHDDDETTLIVRATTTKIMIARIVAMIRENPLMIEKMKVQICSMKNMMMMWITIFKILKMMLKLIGGVTLIVINTG